MKTSIIFMNNSQNENRETEKNQNKLVDKIWLLTLLLIIGFGNICWGQTATYTVASKTSVTTSGTAPTGSSATYSQTYTSTAGQITGSNSATLTLSGYAGYKITNIVLSMKSNTSSGAGSLSVNAGGTVILTIPDSKFNTSNWYSNWSTSYVNITKTPTAYNIQSGESVVINIAASANSLYIQSYTITYTSSPTKPILTTPTATSITTTSATLGAIITSNGGAKLTARGTVWGTSANPTGNILSQGDTTVTAFTHARTGFTANTLYTYRGYATNSAGTGYSPDGNFTTIHNAPNIGSGSGATASSIIANWSTPSGGGSAAFTYEVQVDNNSDFSSPEFTQSSILSSTFSATATGLASGTLYYYRVRANNAGGNSSWSSTSVAYSTLTASSPTITVGTITGFGNQCINTTSSEKSYFVSGANLTANISIAPPTGYEISTGTGGSFVATNPIVLTQLGGIVNSIPIYVRFTPTSATTYSGNISHTSTGSNNPNVAVSGSGTSPVAPSVSIAVTTGANPTCPGTSVTFTATPTNGGTPSYQWKKDGSNVGSNSATYTDAGSVTGNVTCEMTTSLTCVISTTATSNSISLTQSVPNVISPAAAAGNGQVSLAWTNPSCYDEIMIVAAPASNNGTPSGNGSAYTGNLAYHTGTGLGNGYVIYKGTSSPQIITGLTNGTTYYFKLFTRKGSVWSVGTEVNTIPVSGPCFSEDFASISNGNSTSTSGSSTAWTGNTNFPTISTAYQAGGAVRIGKSGNSGSITSSALTGVSGNVTVSFDVKGWSTVEGSINVTLNGETKNVSYTSVMGGSFENKSVLFTNVPNGSNLTIGTSAERAFIDNISLSCAAASPSITTTSLTDFGNICANSTSTEKSFTVSGANLIDNISITAPAGFEISTTSGNGFGATVTLNQSGGTVASTPIYVRFIPTLAQAYTGNINLTSSGATPRNIAVSGTGITVPITPNCSTPSAVCAGVSATITGAGSATATSYTYWTATSSGNSINLGTTPPGTVALSNLTTPTSLTGGTYTYYVQAENSCGSSVARQSVNVTINTIPNTPIGSIIPVANPACGSTTLSYSGASPSIYWETTSNGIATTNPTSSVYPVSTTGTFYVRAYNGNCWSSSSFASSVITINMAPAITSQPANKSVVMPATGTFNIVATGTALTYQWQLNSGSGWIDITSATSDSYNTDATSLSMNGYQYRCVVSGTCIPTTTSNTVTLSVSNFTYASGDFRPSYGTGLANNGAWEYYNGSDWIAVPDGKAPANTSITIGRILIDQEVNAGGSSSKAYNCDFIIMPGGNLILPDNNATPSANMIADGKKLEVLSGGVLTVQGDISVAATGSIIARDGSNVIFDQSSINYNHTMWYGSENFESGSTVTIKDWNFTGSGTGALLNGTSTPTISTNTNGYIFGNLIVDINPSFTWSIVGGGLGIINLCENNFIITNASSNMIIGATNKTGTNGFVVNGNMIINDGPFTFGSSFSNDAFNHQFTINGNFECNSNDVLKIHSNGSGTPTTLNGNVTFKGDVIIASTVTSFSNDGGSGTPARMSVNFDGGNIASPKLIDIVPVATAMNINIKANSARKLSAHDLTTNSVASYTATINVESGAALHFGWADDGTTPLVVKKTALGAAGTNTFSAQSTSTLIITSLDGIQQASSTTGNVQYSTANKTFAPVGTFWYVGKSAQITGDGLSNAVNAKVVICDLIDNNTILTLSDVTGFTSTTTLSATGGKLDIRKGQVVETPTAYVSGSTGTLYMAEGTLYKITKLSTDASDLIPRMIGATYAYNLTGGTIELSGGVGSQYLRGEKDYYSLTFSGGGTKYTSSALTNIGDNSSINTGVVTIKDDSTILDVSNSTFSGNAALVMTNNSTFRMSQVSTTHPQLDGSFTLTGGTIELYGSGAAQTETLRGTDGSSNRITYNNIILNSTAANISNDQANVVVGAGFTVVGTLNLNSPTCLKIGSNYNVDGVGTFNVNAGSTLKYGSTAGITTSSASGNVRTIIRNYSNTASYGFAGSLNQVSGDGLPTSMVNLYIDKTSANATITLTNSAQVGNSLVMNQGHIFTESNLLEIGKSTTETGTLSYTTGYVVGKMRRWFNGTNSGNSTGLFPIGIEDSELKNRNIKIEYTSAPSTGGNLTLQWVASPMNLSGLPIVASNTGGCAFDITSTSEQGYWKIDNASGTLTDGAYTITGTGEGITNITNLAQLTLLKRVNGNNWFCPGTHIDPTGTIAKPTLARSGVSGWSNFGFGSGADNALPVEMISFSANCVDENISINWTTASETNNSHFLIERSEDGINWNTLGSVPGAGNSTTSIQYSFIDHFSQNAQLYRLLQIDFNGKITYFNPITANCKNSSISLISVYPNPFNELLMVNNLDTECDYEITLLETNGKIVSNKKVIKSKTFEFSTLDVTSGLYILKVISSNRNLLFKIVKY